MDIRGKTTETIVNDIEIHISRCPGKYYSEFYIGLSDDPRRQLFSKHQVNEKTDCWTYHRAIDNKSAIKAARLLSDKGMKGAFDVNKNNGIYVYCYHLTSETLE